MKPVMRDALYITAEESVVKLSQLLISKSRDHWSLLFSLTYSSVGFDWMLISATVSSQLWMTPLPHACYLSLREHLWMFQHWFLGGEMKSPPVDWASWGCSGNAPDWDSETEMYFLVCERPWHQGIRQRDLWLTASSLSMLSSCALFFCAPVISLYTPISFPHNELKPQWVRNVSTHFNAITSLKAPPQVLIWGAMS